MREKVIVLVSGGLDSTALLYDLANSGDVDIIPLFFDWGQPAFMQENKALLYMCNELGLTLRRFNIDMKSYSKSSILGGRGGDEVEARNLIFLSFAISLAIAEDVDRIMYGAISSDPDYVFVDATQTFVQRLQDVASLFRPTLRIEAPLITLSKADVADIALNQGVPIHRITSCNTPVRGKPCGVCSDCISTLQYLGASMRPDFLEFIGKMELAEYINQGYDLQPLDDSNVTFLTPQGLAAFPYLLHPQSKGSRVCYTFSPLRLSPTEYAQALIKAMGIVMTAQYEIELYFYVNEDVLPADYDQLMSASRVAVLCTGLSIIYRKTLPLWDQE